MAKLLCPCGNILSNVVYPNERGGYLIRDIDLERMGEKSLDSCEIMRLARYVWECFECGRLGINFPDKDDTRVKWYKPDDDCPGNLMEDK